MSGRQTALLFTPPGRKSSVLDGRNYFLSINKGGGVVEAEQHRMFLGEENEGVSAVPAWKFMD